VGAAPSFLAAGRPWVKTGSPVQLSVVCFRQPRRKTGARGLRSIMESILLDTMFDLPSLEGVQEVVISKQVVEGTAPPLYIYADRSDRIGEASA
jgi:ATP-dependent Clp protease ATP-binding subunit ClpX